MKRRRPLLMRIAIDGAIMAGLLLLGLYGLATYLRRTSMFFPDRYPIGDWKRPANTEEIRFNASDGTQLVGWLVHAPQPDAPLLVWFHGNGGNLTDRTEMAVELAKRGTSVFLFDWRGYGKSEGRPSEDALYNDAMAAWNVAAQRSNRIVLYGESVADRTPRMSRSITRRAAW